MASRAENRWTQWGKYFDENDAKRHWSRKNMLRAFNPRDEVWQFKITSRGRDVFNIARKDLSQSSEPTEITENLNGDILHQ